MRGRGEPGDSVKSHLLPPFALALSALLGACLGNEGTISVSIVGEPDGELLSRVHRVRARLSQPEKTFEGTRDDEGQLDLALEITADGTGGDLVLEGFDAEDQRIVVGRVGPLPWAAIDAEVAAFMAAPNSLSLAPARLSSPRAQVGSTSASFGVLLVGGRDADGPSAVVEAYSAYLHEVELGPSLPTPLSQIGVRNGSRGFVYMLGGNDASGQASSLAFAFDASTGTYFPLSLAEDQARAGAKLDVVGDELFLVSGDPALLLDGVRRSARPLSNGEALDGPPVTLFAEGRLQTIFAGAGVSGGAAVYESGTIRRLEAPEALRRDGHAGVALPGEIAIYLGGAIDGAAVSSAVLYRPTARSFESIELLATPRRNPAVAVTSRHLVVAGGESDDGSPVGDVEIFDAVTLEPVTVQPLHVPRKDATAQALTNGQVLIAGGTDPQGEATDLLELFTPDE